MKLLYIAVFDGNINSGVSKKILQQKDAFQDLGISTEIHFLVNKDLEYRIPSDFTSTICTVPPFKSVLDKIRNLLFLKKELRGLFGILKSYDIIYTRNTIIPANILKNLNKEGVRFVLEIISNNVEEARLRKSKFIKLYNHRFVNARIANYNLLVGITRELVNNLSIKKNIPAVSIGNGIDVKSIPLRVPVNYQLGDKLNLICVANINPWHGLDRLLKGIAKFPNKKRIRFQIIGNGRGLGSIEKLIEDLGLISIVELVGSKYGKELDNYFNEAHLAVGNLAIHRKGLTITSPLKTREYCARGIPFIYAGVDEDFKPDFPYAMRFNADESLIDIQQVINFTENVFKNNNHHLIMRQYAQEHLTWKSKMAKVVDKLF